MTVLETNIAGTVKAFHYVKNHHYLKLKDEEGNEALLLEHGVIAYTCFACSYQWWSEGRMSEFCPCCGTKEIDMQWMQPQVALLPEKESGFQLVKKEKKDVQD